MSAGSAATAPSGSDSSPEEEPGTPPSARWHRPVAIALLLLHGALAWTGRAFGITTGNDDAAYLLLSRSLRHLQYRDIHLQGAPVHSQYPPGFPAFLAVLSPFGEHFDLYLAAIAICSMLALALLYDAVKRSSGPVVALTVLALCALNPTLVLYGGSLMSETLFVLFTTVAVWAVIREKELLSMGQPPPKLALLAGTAAILAALTRSIGVTFLGALFLLWLYERRYRRVAAFAVAGGITVGSWVLWTLLAPSKLVGRSYIADATFQKAGQQSFIGTLLDRAQTNVPLYLTNSIPSLIPEPGIAGTALDNAAGLAVLLVLGTLGARLLWKKAPLIVFYFAAFAVLLTVWPWASTRFLIPVVPFLLWMLLEGAFSLSRKRRWLWPLPFAVAAVVVTTAAASDRSRLRTALQCERQSASTSPRCYDEVQRAFFAAASYARASVPDDAVFLTVKETAFGYLTGLKTLSPVAMRPPNATALLGDLREQKVDHVLLTPLQPLMMQHVPMLLSVCGDLEFVREFSPATLIVRVTPAGGPAPRENACAAISRYARESVPWAPS